MVVIRHGMLFYKLWISRLLHCAGDALSRPDSRISYRNHHSRSADNSSKTADSNIKATFFFRNAVSDSNINQRGDRARAQRVLLRQSRSRGSIASSKLQSWHRGLHAKRGYCQQLRGQTALVLRFQYTGAACLGIHTSNLVLVFAVLSFGLDAVTLKDRLTEMGILTWIAAAILVILPFCF